jgi:ankyrin repeat protein
MGPVQLLSLITYLISNNFPTESNTKEIYKWLKAQGKPYVPIFHAMKGPPAEALRENLFRLAIEAEDIPVVKGLIQAGVNPDGNTCVHKYFPIPLTPLQFACLKGNSLLVQELLEAGSSVDEPRYGWHCSAIALAIFGHALRSADDNAHDYDYDYDYDGDSDKTQDIDSYEHGITALVELISLLLKGDASPIFESTCLATPTKMIIDPMWPLYPLAVESHTPLTIASKYRYHEVVDLLLQGEVDVRFRRKSGTSNTAIRECLYSMQDICAGDGTLRSIPDRGNFHFQGSNKISRIMAVVRSLIDAGADLNDHVACGNDYFCEHFFLECHSVLDLTLLTGNMDLVRIALSAGAIATRHSLDIALQIECFEALILLLNAGAPIPQWAVSETEEAVLFLSADQAEDVAMLQRTRAIFIAAIRFGETTIIDDVVTYTGGSFWSLLEGCSGLTDALENCSRHGHFEMIHHLLGDNTMHQFVPGSAFGRSIYMAIEGGHDALVDMLIEAGADVNTGKKLWDGFKSPLLAAIRKGNPEVVRKLIIAGANLNGDQDCPVHKISGNALVAAIEQELGSTIMDIIDAGVNINTLGQPSSYWWLKSRSVCRCCTPLTMAILKKNWSLIDQLLDAEAFVNTTEDPGMTPLWAAVYQRNESLARSLIGRGAKVNDRLALERAIHDTTLLKLLIEQLMVNNQTGQIKELWWALREAMQLERPQAAQIILDSKMVNISAMEEDATLLHHALASHESQRMMLTKLVLQKGADPNSIVHHDRDYSLTALLGAINTKDPEIVQLILDKGAKTDGDSQANIPYSPVQLSAENNSLDIMRILLTNGSDPNAISSSGKKGAAIQLAAEQKSFEMVELLLKHDSDPDTINQRFPHTALQIAAREGSIEIVEMLLQYGAKVNAPPAEDFGATALQFAAIGGYLSIAHLLLENGADTNAAPAEVEGRTALEAAAEHGRIDMVQLLKNAGADISETGQGQYRRALVRALNNGHWATYQLLQSYSI